MKITKIQDFHPGKKIQGFFLCIEKYLRTKKSGDLYLDMIFQDSSGRIKAKLWDMTDRYLDLFSKGDPVAVKGIPTTYHNELQLTVSHISKADSTRYGKYGFDPVHLIPSISESIEDLYKRLGLIIKSVKKTHYRQLIKNIFTLHKAEISTLPGSVKFHHPIRGGLLKHIVSCGEVAKRVSEYYTDLDSDLVICGALLHDIGKVKSIKNEFNFTRTDEGLLEGHIILGRDLVSDEIMKLKKFPTEDKDKLMHIILSHQGSLSNGSPINPKFPEALLVHYIDELDGKLEMMKRLITEDMNEGSWTDNRNYFKTELWKE